MRLDRQLEHLDLWQGCRVAPRSPAALRAVRYSRSVFGFKSERLATLEADFSGASAEIEGGRPPDYELTQLQLPAQGQGFRPVLERRATP